MRIGVITYWQSKDNYGQHLQIYALQTYLKKLGHDPFLIRYVEEQSEPAHFKFKNLWKYLRNLPLYVKFFFFNRNEQRNAAAWKQNGGQERRDLHGFLSDNVVLSPMMKEAELMANPPEADAYICGSDQIWGGAAPYYLSFAPKMAKKIAYAPSLGGQTSFTSENEEKMKRLIARLDFVGMREQSGVEVCRRLGFNDAVKVVDPTLLLQTEDYDRIKAPAKKQNYAFVYLLGNPTLCSAEKVMEFVRQQGLESVYVPSQNNVDDYEKVFATMGEWLGYLANASLVITNSFHCTVFSLLYHRPFMTLKLHKGYERMNTRVEELLAECDLSSRFIGKEINDEDIYNINFDRFDQYRSREELQSAEYLKQYLN